MFNGVGFLTCAGYGGRYAQSINRPVPFPKHLERIGSRTILSLAIDSMVRHTPVDEIVVSLNPNLEERYIEELRGIAPGYAPLPLRYVVSPPPESGKYIDGLKNQAESNGVYTLEQRRIDFQFDNRVVLLAHGDVFYSVN